jgi:hypothetical protein
MAKTWVLDTETKGTGAQMVPIEKKLPGKTGERELELVVLGRGPRDRPAPEPREPARFRVVDVLSAQTLAEGVGLREAIEALEGLGSVLDARVSVWVPEKQRWRLLRLGEAKALWGFRGRIPAPGA